MKLQRLIVALVCLLGTTCLAQEASRTPPPRSNDLPFPPGFVPPPPGTEPSAAGTPAGPRPPANTPRPTPVPGPVATPATLPPNILAWDSESKDFNVKQGEGQAQFTFYFTNVSTTNVVINSAVASCGCTVPKLPPVPWTNAPGATGEIPVTMNLAGKSGTVI